MSEKLAEKEVTNWYRESPFEIYKEWFESYDDIFACREYILGALRSLLNYDKRMSHLKSHFYFNCPKLCQGMMDTFYEITDMIAKTQCAINKAEEVCIRAEAKK